MMRQELLIGSLALISTPHVDKSFWTKFQDPLLCSGIIQTLLPDKPAIHIWTRTIFDNFKSGKIFICRYLPFDIFRKSGYNQ